MIEKFSVSAGTKTVSDSRILMNMRPNVSAINKRKIYSYRIYNIFKCCHNKNFNIRPMGYVANFV